MTSPNVHETTSLSALRENYLAVPELNIDTLRSMMRAAPHYENDFDATTEDFPTHEYGVLPADGDQPGRVITEIREPGQKLFDGKYQEYNHSATTWKYQEVNAFNGWMGSEVGAALHRLGFAASEIPTDDKGSRLLVTEYPSASILSTRLTNIAEGSVTFVAGAPLRSDTPETTVRQLAEGIVTVLAQPDKQASFSLFNAPVWGLLPPEFTQLVQAKAAHVLDPESPPISWTVKQNPETGSYLNDNVRIFRASLGMVSLVGLLPALNTALAEKAETFSPSAVDTLGYTLRDALETDQAKLPDHGRALAEAAIRHMRSLAVGSHSL